MARCPKCGEASTDAEYCSECGAAMLAAPAGAAAAPPAAPAPASPVPAPPDPDALQSCPVCGEARPGKLARFCDTCRYDFVTATPFSPQALPAAIPGAANPSAASAAAPVPHPAGAPASASVAATGRPTDQVSPAGPFDPAPGSTSPDPRRIGAASAPEQTPDSRQTPYSKQTPHPKPTPVVPVAASPAPLSAALPDPALATAGLRASSSAGPGPLAPGVGAPPLPASRLRWELLGQVDESLRKLEDPYPSDHSERLFPLDLADHLIGRRSDSEDIHPEIVIPDPGISRRHARILRRPDGCMALVDLGSMNGTRLNGAPVEPNVIHVLAEDDEVTLGCWTRLKLRTA